MHSLKLLSLVRLRRLITFVTFVLLIPTAYAEFKFSDVMKVVPIIGPVIQRNALEAAQAAKKATLDQECHNINKLMEAGPLPSNAGYMSNDVINRSIDLLIEDARYSSAFGKTYDQMTTVEVTHITRDVLTQCFYQNKILEKWNNQRGVIYTLFDPNKFQSNISKLQSARSSNGELVKIVDELNKLQPNEYDYEKLKSLKSSADSVLKKASVSQQESYKVASKEAVLRVAAPIEIERANVAVASANGYEGIIQLSKIPDSFLIEKNTQPYNQAMKSLAARMEKIALEISEVERSRIDALGSGLTGLERGVQWQNEFSKKYAEWATAIQGLRDAQDYFSKWRNKTLTAASSDFSQSIRKAKSDRELYQIEQRYLLKSDSQTAPGTKMLTMVTDQKRELEKQSALGDSLNDERLETAAANASEVKSKPIGKKVNNTSQTSNGEPTQEVMYDLVRSRFESEAKRIQDLSRRCSNGGFNGNMVDGVACLSIMAAGGLGASEPVKITHFEKLGCAPASGKPGFYCEFDYDISGGPTKFMGPIMQSLNNDAGIADARFLRRSSGWIMIYRVEQ